MACAAKGGQAVRLPDTISNCSATRCDSQTDLPTSALHCAKCISGGKHVLRMNRKVAVSFNITQKIHLNNKGERRGPDFQLTYSMSSLRSVPSAGLSNGILRQSICSQRKIPTVRLLAEAPGRKIQATGSSAVAVKLASSAGNADTKCLARQVQHAQDVHCTSRTASVALQDTASAAESSLSGLLEIALWSLLNDCLKQCNWQVALDVFAAMKQAEEYKASVNVYTVMLRIMAKAKQPHRALQLFQEMQTLGFHPDAYVFTALLDAYGRTDMLDQAVAVFEHMKATPCCMPNALTYGCMMAAYGRVNQWDKIKALFQEMREMGLKPLSLTFNVVISAYGKAALWDKMEGALDAMVAAGCTPDTTTYNTMLDAYGKHSQYFSMERTINRMHAAKCRADVLTYSSLMDAYRKSGQYKKMEETLEHMRKAGFRPDVKAFSLLIDVYGKRGMFERMKATLQEMRAAGCQANVVTYTAIVDAYGKAGRYKEMEDVWASMKALGLQPDPAAFIATISAYGRHGLYEKMQARFEELQETTKKMRFVWPEPGRTAYNVLIDAYGKGKRIDRMEAAFGAMESKGHQPDVVTYSALINAYGKAGRLAKMDLAYVLMRVTGVLPNRHTFCALIDGYAKVGMVEKAEAIVDDMIKAGFELDLVAFTSIINAYGSSKRFEDMAVRFEGLKAAGLEPSCQTIGALLSALGACHSHKEVSALLSCIRSCKAYRVIAWLLEEREEGQDQDSLWKHAVVLFEGLQSEGTAPRLVLYDALVEALWRFGWQGRAWQVLMAGRERGVFPHGRVLLGEELMLDLHTLSVNVAQIVLLAWLLDLGSVCVEGALPYEQVTVVTGWGRRSRVEGDSPLKTAVTARLSSMGSPFKIPGENAGRLVASIDQVHQWLSKEHLGSHLYPEDAAVPGPDHLLCHSW